MQAALTTTLASETAAALSTEASEITTTDHRTMAVSAIATVTLTAVSEATTATVALTVVSEAATAALATTVVYAFSTALGFALALIVFAGIREQQALVRIPKGMQGVAIVMVTAALLSLAFMGFSGVDGGLKSLFGLE